MYVGKNGGMEDWLKKWMNDVVIERINAWMIERRKDDWMKKKWKIEWIIELLK